MDKFPFKEDTARIETISDYYKIFRGDIYPKNSKEAVFQMKQYFQNSPKKREILAVAVNIGALVSTTFADFFVGEGFKIRHSDQETEQRLKDIKEAEDLDDKVYESALTYSFAGFTNFEIFKRDGKAVITEIPFDNYFPDTSGPLGQKPEKITVANYFKRGESETKYIAKKDYTKGKIERSVWTVDAQGKVDKKRVWADFFTTPESEETPISDDLTIISINNIRTVKERFGTSDFKKVLGLLEEINDRFTQISLQFVKHLMAKMALPRGVAAVDEHGNIKSEDLEVFMMEAGESPPTYLEYKNPLIESAFSHIDKTIDMICAITQVPRELFASEKGGVEKVEALEIRLLPFMKKVARARRAYSNAIRKMLKMAYKVQYGDDLETIGLKIEFDAGFPVDKVLQSTALEKGIMNGFVSKKRAIAEFNGIEGDELNNEIDQIAEEEKINVKLPSF